MIIPFREAHGVLNPSTLKDNPYGIIGARLARFIRSADPVTLDSPANHIDSHTDLTATSIQPAPLPPAFQSKSLTNEAKNTKRNHCAWFTVKQFISASQDNKGGEMRRSVSVDIAINESAR